MAVLSKGLLFTQCVIRDRPCGPDRRTLMDPQQSRSEAGNTYRHVMCHAGVVFIVIIPSVFHTVSSLLVWPIWDYIGLIQSSEVD